MTQKLINKQIIITALLLIFVLLFFQFTEVDFFVQDYLYNFDKSIWIWNRDEPISELLLYSGLKKSLIIFAFIVLVLLIVFWKSQFIKEYKFGMVVIVLSSIIVPFSVITLKNYTNMPCPKNVIHYNGTYPNIKLFEYYPEDFVQNSKIRCWPAGHASGGFALMSIFFLFKKGKNKIMAISISFLIAWSMALYKMLIGDHFLSHTLVTLLIAWLEILIIVKYTKRIFFEKST